MDVTFSQEIEYLNFKQSGFVLSAYSNESDSKSQQQQQHKVALYNYWAYDSESNLPSESVNFIKLINVINAANPTTTKKKRFSKKVEKLGANNYLFLSR